jgi:hypothetical protein
LFVCFRKRYGAREIDVQPAGIARLQGSKGHMFSRAGGDLVSALRSAPSCWRRAQHVPAGRYKRLAGARDGAKLFTSLFCGRLLRCGRPGTTVHSSKIEDRSYFLRDNENHYARTLNTKLRHALQCNWRCVFACIAHFTI